MADVHRHQVEVRFDDLTDVLSAYVPGTISDRVHPAQYDGHLLLELDESGQVVGIELLNASVLKHSYWKTHPDRNSLPLELIQGVDHWMINRL